MTAPISHNNSPWRNRFMGLLVTLVTVVLFMSVTEIALRVMTKAPPATAVRDPEVHPVLGIVVPPHINAKDTFAEYQPQGYINRRTDSHGFYEDREVSPTPPPGVTRIGVVGDSQTAGACDNSDSYPNQLERILNSRPPGASYDVVNAGAGRYSPYQYHLRARHFLLPVSPKELIVGIYIGNDFNDLTRVDDRPFLTSDGSRGYQPHPPRFIIKTDPAHEPSWIESTRTYQMVWKTIGAEARYQITRAQLLFENASRTGRSLSDTVRYMMAVRDLTAISRNLMTQSLYQFVWFQYFPETLDEAIRQQRETMKLNQKLCRDHGIRLRYLLIPAKPQIESDDIAAALEAVERYNPAYTRAKLVEFCDRLSGEVRQSAAELGIELADATEALRKARQATGKRLYYFDDQHLTRDGNAVVAEVLASRY